MPEDVYIGIDIGGTRIRAARLTRTLEIQARTETPSLADEGVDAVIGRIFSQGQAVWPADGSRVAGIGISAAGPLNPMTGVVVKLTNFKGWHNVPLRELCHAQFGVETYLGNDANVAALAETTLGAARGYRDVVFLTISTGIGAGVICAGKMLVGSKGLGAECGHIIMIAEENRVSTLEKEAAGPAIARTAREAIERGEKSSILDRAGGSLEAITAKDVGESAEAGDPLAKKLIARAGWMIGLGIVSMLHVFNPEIVVLGGGVVDGTWNLLEDPMRRAIQEYSLTPEYWDHLVIARAALGENVSLIGAGALALHKGA